MPGSPPTSSRSTLGPNAAEGGSCKRIFNDKVSATKADHPRLADAVSDLRHADVLAIWKLDRLGAL